MNEIKYYWQSTKGEIYEDNPFYKNVESLIFYREIMEELEIPIFE